jgi:hypothetical protein
LLRYFICRHRVHIWVEKHEWNEVISYNKSTLTLWQQNLFQ